MLEDASGNIWVRSYEGIYCFNQALELKYFLEHSHTYPMDYASQEMTKEMFIDNTGAIWYFSPEGINQLRRIKQNFQIYTTAPLLQTWVRCIYPESKDKIWFGTLQGIHRLDRNKNLNELIYGHGWVQGFTSSANSMLLDMEGTLWLGFRHEGMLSMVRSDTEKVAFRKHWPVNVDSSRMEEYGFNRIDHLFEDREGRLWVGSLWEVALQYYDRAENRMIRLVDNPSSTDRLPKKAVMRHQTGTDTLWAIGSSGVYRIIQPLERISEDEALAANVIRCRLLDENGNNFELQSVTFTYIDDSGNLWAGSDGGGLLRIMRSRSHGSDDDVYYVKTYSTQQGLPGDRVLSMLPDGKGKLWLGTNNGLAKFNPSSETFVNYYVRHGLPTNEFIRKSSAMDPDGEMFFGTLAGLIAFYPDSIVTNQNVPPVWITDFRVNNQLIQPGNNTGLDKSITFSDHIKLKHNQDNLSFEYAILNYDNPELNQFRYILEGFNDDWVYAGNRTNVEYTNLGHGRYTFRVLGSNNDGIWNEEGTSFGITISPPPWQTWHAYLIYGMIVSGIILWYRRYQRKRADLRMAVEVE
jgi:ligand-binding sensor domain-containing protein